MFHLDLDSTRALAVSTLVLGVLFAVVLLAAVPTAAAGGEGQLSTAVVASSSGSVSDVDSEEYTDTVVVRFADEHVVTGDAAESVPSDPVVTADGDDLVVVDGTVETDSGDPIVVENHTVRAVDGDPDLVVTDGHVLNDTLEVTENGSIQTVEGESAVTTEDGDGVRYRHVNETNFRPEITDINTPGEGEPLEVTVDITNTEYGTGEKNVTLTLSDGDELATLNESVSLEGGETTTETFEYETVRGDHTADEVIVDVEYDGNQDRQAVTIHESKAVVNISDWTNTAAGDELEVVAEINRYGNYPPGDQEFLIDFSIDGDHVTTKPVDIEPGGEATETFTYETNESDSPSVEATVESGSGGPATAVVDVLGQATHEQNVEAEFVDRNWPDEGDTLELTAEIGYDRWDRIPDEPQEYPIEFSIDDELVENRTVELDGDETLTETFEYETEQGDAPRVDAALDTPGSGDTARPRVNGSGFDVEIEAIDEPVNASEELVTTVVLENTGDLAGEQEVRMRIDTGYGDPHRTNRQIRDRKNISLDVGERTTEQFSYRTADRDVPEVEVAILSETDEALGNATVRASTSRYEPQNLTAEYTNDTDRELTLSSEINNTGTEPDDQYVEFMLDDELVYVDRVSLDPWESTNVSTTIDAPEESGAYDFTVETDDKTAEETVGVGVEIIDDEPSDESDEPSSNQSDTEPTNESESATDPPEEEAGLPWFLILLGLLGVLVSSLTLLVYRNDPENFPPEPAAVPGILEEEVTKIAHQIRATNLSMLVATVKGVVGLGAGTLVVQNKLPRAATVRVRCQTAEETVFMQDLELQPDERRTLASLPDVAQFRVGAGVDDITSHEEVFEGDSGDVGVVLRAEGLVIANLS
ncbi:hypothetical protein C500_06115 [Natrialba magadii ATCC 43099]|uniref:CARDB domain-containing protein n=1 Tax=Natrialba magadii (strain ATCC 43099 / DSM 3394 / CCM 3739 / CIP 104546 / IAM 13178 / JCM 8861 / NBRC 102185 / NCIMB 2190 / MS3) TaxID=547559 RepID=L9V5R5_NATMM|nr:hypothetical protein [Natrialba magadii]ELY31703.1 hypothetical protein C500_06115 [Natrialba magadii ATCC 43099]